MIKYSSHACESREVQLRAVIAIEVFYRFFDRKWGGMGDGLCRYAERLTVRFCCYAI
jgi:hypothetical protein